MTILDISTMNVLIWALFGLVIGFLVHLLDPIQTKGGIFATAGLGVLGSLVGGLTATLLFKNFVSGFPLQEAGIVIIGGFILALIYRFTLRNRNYIKTINMRVK